jgi:glucose uptake protein
VFFFAVGILLSNLVFNTFIMARPFVGEPVTWADYGRGTLAQHAVGIVGGMIWCIGMTLNIIAAAPAGPAISYALGQGATMIAAVWGVFVWKEFREAPPGTNRLLALMFVCFVVGLAIVAYARIVAIGPQEAALLETDLEQCVYLFG